MKLTQLLVDECKKGSKLKFSLFIIVVLCFTSQIGQADPWGKDAELAHKSIQKTSCQNKCETPFLGKFAETMIRFHQNVISPADGPRSHFIPSSSQYTLEAMRKYGFFKGFTMGCDRLMRENKDPWVYRVTLDGAGRMIKYDPVP